MLDVRSLTTEELWQNADSITKELARRQEELQQTCAHPKYVAIMYTRPGDTYRGCKVCQKPAPSQDHRSRVFRLRRRRKLGTAR